MLNSYDEFLDNYSPDISEEIKKFKTIDENSMSEEDLANAEDKINDVYDIGVGEFFTNAIFDNDRLNVREVADLALRNMNRYGTEMKQVLNALQDFNGYLSKYMQDEDEDENS